ncbi:heme ABC transporter permease [Nitrospira sp.]|nr:heme ABC transporter permease [Nitrospira sp.]
MVDTDTFIVVHLRVPRLILALCVGGILSLVGACLQGLLRNPLADPYVLGISSGATLGATLALTVGGVSAVLGGLGVTLCALGGGLAVMIVLYRLSSSDGRLPLPTVLLLGVVINAILSAMAMFVTSILSPEHLARVLSWLMGSLAAIDSWRLVLTAASLLVGMGIAMHHARHLNGLLVGDETAQAIGIPVERVKRTLFLTCATLTGVAVAVSGMVGFVGMVVPHAVRLLIGSDHRLLLPAVVLAGGGFLMCADTMARTMLAPSELPVGVVTALLGGPLFVHILLTHRHRETIGARP